MEIVNDEIRIKRNLQSKKWREEHHQQFLETRRKYYQNHKEKYKKNNDNWRKKHYEEHYKKYVKEYIRVYSNKKRKNDSIYYQKYRIRNFILRAFTRKGFTKRSRSTELLGCDFDTFYNYLLQTFKNIYGYEWNGVEKVHIDHIIPLDTAITIEDIEKLSHYTNLQLLKQKDNLKKSNKINFKIGEEKWN